MKWNDHSNIEGTHAFLSPSKHAWLNYDKEKLEEVYRSMMAKERGTRLHEFASECIKMRQKLPRQHITFNMFVNDAIGYDMDSEIPLFYSYSCYGTADAIKYDSKKKILRIHDLKTGKTPASMSQLETYAALFCLEYDITPNELNLIELRIYQNDEVFVEVPEPDLISYIMGKIIEASAIIEEVQREYY